MKKSIGLLLMSLLSVKGTQYVGCYYDEAVSELGAVQGTGLTVEECTDLCGLQSFNYSGLQAGGDCRCSNEFGSFGLALETDCNDPCDADLLQVCGGGLRNSIYHSQHVLCDNECFTSIDYQYCHDRLEALVFDSIRNECEPVSIADEQYYRFHISYQNGYNFDPECLAQTITFQNLDTGDIEIPGLLYNEVDDNYYYGNDIYPTLPNQYFAYIPATNDIQFTIKHTDMEALGCTKEETDDAFIWQCSLDLHIWFTGVEQYTYSFCMHVTLIRDSGWGQIGEEDPIRRGRPLSVTILPNEFIAQGECCENELNIQTTLKFCTDMTCDDYLPEPLTVERKQNIYVEHSIVTTTFQYYYLHGLQLRVGVFIPEILATDGSNPGRLIYKFRSNIAQEGMIIEAISRIDEDPMARRSRFLQEDQESLIGEDYQLNAFSQFSVTQGDLSEQNGDFKEQKQGETSTLGHFMKSGGNKAAVILVSILFVASIVMLIGVCFKKRAIKQLQQDSLKKMLNSKNQGDLKEDEFENRSRRNSKQPIISRLQQQQSPNSGPSNVNTESNEMVR